MIEKQIVLIGDGEIPCLVSAFVFDGLAIYLKKTGKGVKHWVIIHVASGNTIGAKTFIMHDRAKAIAAVKRLNTLSVIWQWSTFDEVAISGGMNVFALKNKCIQELQRKE